MTQTTKVESARGGGPRSTGTRDEKVERIEIEPVDEGEFAKDLKSRGE